MYEFPKLQIEAYSYENFWAYEEKWEGKQDIICLGNLLKVTVAMSSSSDYFEKGRVWKKKISKKRLSHNMFI